MNDCLVIELIDNFEYLIMCSICLIIQSLMMQCLGAFFALVLADCQSRSFVNLGLTLIGGFLSGVMIGYAFSYSFGYLVTVNIGNQNNI